MDEAGTVTISYMGTDPPTSTVVTNDAKELNYEDMDEEHRQLLQTIRESQSDSRAEPKEKVMLRVQVPPTLDYETAGKPAPRGGGGAMQWSDGSGSGTAQLTVRLFVSYTGLHSLDSVGISLDVPDCVVTKDTSFVIPSLPGGTRTPLIIPLVFEIRQQHMPTHLRLRVAAAYTSSNNEPRTASCEADLPLCVVCKLVPSVKTSTFKFTIDTNRPAPQLSVLFEDMFSQPGLSDEAIQEITSSKANSLSFQYYNGAEATVLASKTGGRYRVQSGSLEALWIISQELVRRMQDHFGEDVDMAGGSVAPAAGGLTEPFALKYAEPLPLGDFFQCIDDHFECRLELAKVRRL